jgi:hypothetical protein
MTEDSLIMVAPVYVLKSRCVTKLGHPFRTQQRARRLLEVYSVVLMHDHIVEHGLDNLFEVFSCL